MAYMSEQIPSGEKEPARWENTYLGSGDSALVLRRGDTSIGALAYETIETPKGKTFYLQYLAIEEAERSPGVLLKLMKAIRKNCQENNIEYVSFAVLNDSESKALSDLGTDTFQSPGGVEIALISVSDVGVDTLRNLPTNARAMIHDRLSKYNRGNV